MIHRGTNHVIFSRFDMVERIRRDSTIDLLLMLMWYYDSWSDLNKRRSENTGFGNVSLFDQSDEFKKLMAATKKWLQPDGALEDDADLPPPPSDSIRKSLGQAHDPEEYGLFPSRGSSSKTERTQLKRKRVPLK